MSTSEKHTFQAEIQQLLSIVIHSLYTDKEIFVRELISNAADALEKLRFLKTSGEKVVGEELFLKVSITTDDQAKTVSFADTGVGMTRQELIDHLGVIAKSGSKQFLEQLSAGREKEKDRALDLIGQFGVGFYSSFMVAGKVEVFTRSYRLEEKHGWCWSSTGSGHYEIEPAAGLERGTKVVLHLKDSESDFSRSSHMESVIKRYSSFVPFPIELNGTVTNTVQAIWSRNKNEITEEQYKEFYHYIGHTHDEPKYRLHFSADAPLSIQALLFVPPSSLERLGLARQESEVNLYSRKVLIEPKAKGLFPDWLRFLKGVVDSEDMPLNISRETMQDSALMQKLNRVLTMRFLKMLEEAAQADPAKYQEFFTEFGHCLKEGIITDHLHRDALAGFMRFESSSVEKGRMTSFNEYISRMKPEQKEIYFLSAPDRASAEASPYFEVFRARQLEVLFLYDPRDEVVMDYLREVEEKRLQAAEKANLDFESEARQDGLSVNQARLLTNWFKELLGERVGEVRSSKRLVESPAVVLESDPHLTSAMRRVMRNMQREGSMFESKLNMEINPSHPLIFQLEKARQNNPDLAKMVAEQIFDNALFAAGLLEERQPMIERTHRLMEEALQNKT